MAKKMKKLEKECQSWKTRFDGCNKSLIDMVADVRNISLLSFIASFKGLVVCDKWKNTPEGIFILEKTKISTFITMFHEFQSLTESNQGKGV